MGLRPGAGRLFVTFLRCSLGRFAKMFVSLIYVKGRALRARPCYKLGLYDRPWLEDMGLRCFALAQSSTSTLPFEKRPPLEVLLKQESPEVYFRATTAHFTSYDGKTKPCF